MSKAMDKVQDGQEVEEEVLVDAPVGVLTVGDEGFVRGLVEPPGRGFCGHDLAEVFCRGNGGYTGLQQ